MAIKSTWKEKASSVPAPKKKYKASSEVIQIKRMASRQIKLPQSEMLPSDENT